MDIDLVFKPLADELTGPVFGTDVVFHQHGAKVFDPLTGAITGADTDHNIQMGILSRKRVEDGGPQEVVEIQAWLSHGVTGVAFLPTTEDTFTYDGILWKLTAIDPTYSAKGLIASKLTARTS